MSLEGQVLLAVENLSVSFPLGYSRALAVEHVSFCIKEGRTLGVVGESGSGKSATAMSLVRLTENNGGKVEAGKAVFAGKDLLAMSGRDLRSIRGRDIGIIFQEPMTSLNPLYPIGKQISEVFRIHEGMSYKQAWPKTIELLNKVKIPSPEVRYHEFPHQLSGGMRQRVMIAMALALSPKLLIADEPTTALDVTIQSQILGLLRDLRQEFGTSVIFITHDLGVVSDVCDDVIVMYGGRVVEQGPTRQVLDEPHHPYTRGLLKSRPKIGQNIDKLPVIEGMVPSLGQFPSGCRFQNRCSRAKSECFDREPPMTFEVSNRGVACYFPLGDTEGAKQ